MKSKKVQTHFQPFIAMDILYLIFVIGVTLWTIPPRKYFSLLFGIYIACIVTYVFFESTEEYVVCVWEYLEEGGELMCKKGLRRDANPVGGA